MMIMVMMMMMIVVVEDSDNADFHDHEMTMMWHGYDCHDDAGADVVYFVVEPISSVSLLSDQGFLV